MGSSGINAGDMFGGGKTTDTVNTSFDSTTRGADFDASSSFNGGDGGSSFGLDHTSVGIVTNSTNSSNRLDFSALHQSSNAFTVDASLTLSLDGNRKNNKKTAKEKEKK